MKKIGWFIFDNMYLGRFAPRFFGWLIGAKPVRVERPTVNIKEDNDFIEIKVTDGIKNKRGGVTYRSIRVTSSELREILISLPVKYRSTWTVGTTPPNETRIIK